MRFSQKGPCLDEGRRHVVGVESTNPVQLKKLERTLDHLHL